MTCVYWEGEDQTAAKVDASAGEEAEASHWSVKGCWVAYSDENYTICSCSHLSTFALVLQIGDVRTKQPTLSRVDCSMCRLGSLWMPSFPPLTDVFSTREPQEQEPQEQEPQGSMPALFDAETAPTL